ncbi:MAG: rod shape-determining protein MreD [Aquisalinus sp.]|nr:rod shape-determining protein MreD [Aquisalinus sp.]
MIQPEQGFAGILRALTPTLLGFIGVLLLSVPLRLFEGTVPTPVFPLIVIFFWSLYAAEYMPSVSTFFIGLLQDLLLGGPMGMWAIAYLVTQYAMITQRSYFLGREQHVVWLGFLVAAIMAGTIIWLAMSIFAGNWMPVRPVIWQVLVTFAFYPVMAVAFSSLHERVIVEQ